MTADPTKNLPWSIKRDKRAYYDAWVVVDSTGADVTWFAIDGRTAEQAEFLARMVAAGSVAGELYVACELAQKWLANSAPLAHLDGPTPMPILTRALAAAAPLCEPKPENGTMNGPPIPALPDFAVMHWDASLEQWEVYGYRNTSAEAHELAYRAQSKGCRYVTMVVLTQVIPIPENT